MVKNERMAKLLELMIENNASDLHISAGSPPYFRIDEDLLPVEGFAAMTSEETQALAYSMLSPGQIQTFEREKELDLSFGVDGGARYRVNLYQQRNSVSAAIRILPAEILSFEQCGLPDEIMETFGKAKKGLVLVTGSTGSGKSTTLASLVGWINHYRQCHLLTMEDPIEFVHKNDNAIINQREIGTDSNSFDTALKYALRQDPDVILVGEMRDMETIEAALTIAETGHLVLATLHTADAVQTVNRIIDVFPPHKQQQVKIQLSFVLLGVVAQQLVPKLEAKGRQLVAEILICNHAVRALIREGKAEQLYSVLQTGQREGMITMNQSLAQAYMDKHISYEDAIARAQDQDEFLRLINH